MSPLEVSDVLDSQIENCKIFFNDFRPIQSRHPGQLSRASLPTGCCTKAFLITLLLEDHGQAVWSPPILQLNRICARKPHNTVVLVGLLDDAPFSKEGNLL